MSPLRIAAAAAAAALLAAAPDARAYVRSTDACTHVCVYWPVSPGARIVTYTVNEGGSWSVPACNTSPASPTGAWRAAVDAAFSQWTSATQSCTDLHLQPAPQPSSSVAIGWTRAGPNENLIVFRKGPCSKLTGVAGMADRTNPCWSASTCGNTYDCYEDHSPTDVSILALTTVTYDPRSGAIYDADMELNDAGVASGAIPDPANQNYPRDGWYFTCNPPPGGTVPASTTCTTYGDPSDCAFIDLQNTVTHEAGHFIGLAHPPKGAMCSQNVPCDDTTMAATAGLRDINKRVLSADDVAGLCEIYPAGQASATCAYHDTCAKSGCSCGLGAGPAGALALVAVRHAAPRRRRVR